jgi:hypothetical protein
MKIPDLLHLAGITSANRMVVKAVSVEAWMCKHSDDGKNGARNYVGSLLIENNKTDMAKKTSLAKTGEITVPLRGGDTFIVNAATVWNKSGTLRNALTKAAAKKAALDLAKTSPL